MRRRLEAKSGGHRSRLIPTAVAAVALFWALFGATDAMAGAIISNGTVTLGVNDAGHLNFNGVVNDVSELRGVTFVPTNNDATRAGCACEGWGAANVDADPAKAFSGKANASQAVTVSQGAFSSTASTATSVTTIAEKLRVTHEFRPFAGSPNLYEVFVTLSNIGVEGLADVRYTRGMDWDVEPTPFAEFITIRRGNAAALRYSSDNGFEDNDPLAPRSPLNPAHENAEVIHAGPSDHGALFDFGFGPLAVGESRTFSIFYGAAATEAQADAAVGAAGAEVFSYGQPSNAAGALDDTINTFVFAFRGVAGRPVFSPTLTLSPPSAANAAGAAHTVTAELRDTAGGPFANAPLLFAVSGANPQAPAARTTGADGRASFTYTGANAGTDDITACLDTDADARCSANEVTARAAATFTAPAAPSAAITSGPQGVVQASQGTFTFSSDQPNVTFECRVDAGAFVPCASPFVTPQLAPGPHTFDVRARNAAGVLGPVIRRSFTVAAAPDRDADGIPDDQDTSDASGGPRLFKTVVARLISGEVFVRLPAASRSRVAPRQAQAPPGFIPLKGAALLPVGTIVDAARGRLALTAAASRTKTERSEFYDGIFQLRQKRAPFLIAKRRVLRPVTELTLRSANFRRVCGSGAQSVGARAAGAGPVARFVARARPSKKVVSRLWGNGRGRFRTTGRHSAATVRGTIWLTQERCDGTLTRVTRGVVRVFDTGTKKTVTVRAGSSYLARAVRASIKAPGR